MKLTRRTQLILSLPTTTKINPDNDEIAIDFK